MKNPTANAVIVLSKANRLALIKAFPSRLQTNHSWLLCALKQFLTYPTSPQSAGLMGSQEIICYRIHHAVSCALRFLAIATRVSRFAKLIQSPVVIPNKMRHTRCNSLRTINLQRSKMSKIKKAQRKKKKLQTPGIKAKALVVTCVRVSEQGVQVASKALATILFKILALSILAPWI